MVDKIQSARLAGKFEREKAVRLSPAELALVSAGIEIMREAEREREVAVREPGGELFYTPVVEATLYVAIAAWKVYTAYKSGAIVQESILGQRMNEMINAQSRFSLDELVALRDAAANVSME